MTGLCRATMTEEYHLRAKSIEEIDEQDLEIAVELLTKDGIIVRKRPREHNNISNHCEN